MQYPIAHLPMLGKGSVLLDRFDASGNSTGLIHLGNCSKFEIEPKDEKAELYGSLNKSTSLLATALKKRTFSISITGTDFAADKVALVTMSSGKVTTNQLATAVVAEALASAAVTKKGKYFKTAKKFLDVTLPGNTVVKQGATTLVLGTDYTIVDDAGLIYFPATSTVNDATAVTVDYKPLARSIDTVPAGTQALLTGKLVFVPDPTDGAKIGVEVWRVNLSPSGAMGLIADDYGNWSLDGAVLDDTANHPAAPFYELTYY